jgi:hypothetical protein
MQDTSKDLGYMRRDIRQICLFEPVDCGMSDMSITWSTNKGENIAQRVCVELYYISNNTAEKTRASIDVESLWPYPKRLPDLNIEFVFFCGFFTLDF